MILTKMFSILLLSTSLPSFYIIGLCNRITSFSSHKNYKSLHACNALGILQHNAFSHLWSQYKQYLQSSAQQPADVSQCYAIEPSGHWLMSLSPRSACRPLKGTTGLSFVFFLWVTWGDEVGFNSFATFGMRCTLDDEWYVYWWHTLIMLPRLALR